jgi:hypothetical protein
LLIVAQASRPNFSGRWELDKSRSDFGSLPPDDSAMELIQHQEPITITQVWKMRTHCMAMTTDGTENLARINETEIASRTVWEDSILSRVENEEPLSYEEILPVVVRKIAKR